jgi:hypothetical protein
MADTIFTRALSQAMAMHGSTQALAYALRVPEATLLRWVAGRAQMPLAAFHHVVDELMAHEAKAEQPAGANGVHPVQFNIGEVVARCPRCHGAEFSADVAPDALTMRSVLCCRSCGHGISQGELLRELATSAIRDSRSAASRRGRQPPGAAVSPRNQA